jgi:hypothetical protein
LERAERDERDGGSVRDRFLDDDNDEMNGCVDRPDVMDRRNEINELQIEGVGYEELMLGCEVGCLHQRVHVSVHLHSTYPLLFTNHKSALNNLSLTIHPY